MEIKVLDSKIEEVDAQVLILPIFKNAHFSPQIKKIDQKLDGILSEIIEENYFSPELNQIHALYTFGKIKHKKIILVGLGAKKDLNNEKLFQSIARAISYLGKINAKSCAIYLGEINIKNLSNILETAQLSLYKFHNYKSKKQNAKLESMIFIIENNLDHKIRKEIIRESQVICQEILNARDLINHPSNVITPKYLAKVAQKLNSSDLKTTIYDEKQINDFGLGLMSAVAKGSAEDAQFIILDYTPTRYSKTLAIVGKGVTFDSGGISIKPSEKMDEMKMDMSGAAAVLSVMSWIRKIKPKNIRIIGVIAATENLLGHHAQKPGDIYKSYNGKTVEIINTDAEGRLILADAISYIEDKFKPNYLIDIATLTGACLVALGKEYTGLFGNDEKLIKRFMEISEKSYEKLWHLPINDVFRGEIKSQIADLKNLSSGYEAGASTAAAFLEEFVGAETKWIHLDIGGPAILSRPMHAYHSHGATGAGVKTLIEFIKDLD